MAQPGEISGYKFFSSSDADDGDYSTPAVAAVTGKKIRVMSLAITVVTTAGVVTIKSNTTAKLAHHLALGTPLVLGASGIPVCETASGEALVPSNAAGVDSFCSGTYVEVEP
jgi:hypothetical protein